ncbi:MAG: single-stranded-DNA-specific exonuclease RecJ [Vampirovibrionales bacterium]|nr:single-stranded-DNA-specific exonuclease RecJ [Vampirovibrionales bacterium]
MLTSLDPTPFADPDVVSAPQLSPLASLPLQQGRWLQVTSAQAPSPELVSLAKEHSPQGYNLLAQLLANRGWNDVDEAAVFLDLVNFTPTSGLELPDADIGLERMVKAIDNQEPILIYGDFDVDGQTGTSVFVHTLKTLGAKVSHYIPDRSAEGHGLNATALCKLVSSRNTRLVITTDTGITNFNEVSLLNGLGVETIVTDHHDLAEQLPPGVANINPKRLSDKLHPLYHLCGAGVALKLCELLLEQYDADPVVMETLYAIAAIGTVVDMMPLVRENRWLVWRGLQSLNNRETAAPCVGIDALIAVAGGNANNPITAETIGFTIGPRLNALGRLERADAGVTLLTTDNPAEAETIAKHLDALNRQRQGMCEETLLQAEQALAKRGGLNGEKAIALASPDWHAGIIGLAASRLKDRYNVPVFLMIVDEATDTIKGSARSIEGFNLHTALTHCSRWFKHYGGHAGAGGFALARNDFDAFRSELLAYCQGQIPDDVCKPTVRIDAELQWDQLHLGLLEIIQSMAPFGQANPAPLFMTQPLQIKVVKRMGDRSQHLKLLVAPENDRNADPIEALLWQRADEYPVEVGQVVRLVVAPECNTFNGNSRLQLKLQDLGVVSGSGASKNVRPALQVASVPPKTITPVIQSVGQPAVSSAPVWLDHRPREAVQTLVAQLMQPKDLLSNEGESTTALLFHESPTPPDIPFLSPEQLVTRQNALPAQRLVLWDLPPSPQVLNQLLKTVSPSRIHVVGAVWQAQSVHQPVEDWLRSVYRHLKNSAPSDNTPLQIAASTLACQWGVTGPLVLASLSLFGRMGLVHWESTATGEEEMLTLTFQQPTAKLSLTDFPEYALIGQLWQPIRAYRQWLLSASLDDIQRQAATPY